MPPSSPPRNTDELQVRRERRKQARPGELLDAALDLFVEKGFAATRVEEIAARAGVSKGTLFLYFPTKEDLFKAVVRENIGTHLGEWKQELEAFEGSAADMLRCCLEAWCERIVLTRASGITKLMFSEAQNFPEVARFYEEEVIQPGKALIRQVLERGIARGEFRELDLEHAVFAVVTPMIFLALHRHTLGLVCGESIDPQRYLKAHADTLLHGFCARPASDPRE